MATLSLHAEPVLPALRARRGLLEPYDLVLAAALAITAVLGWAFDQRLLMVQPWVGPNVLTNWLVLLAALAGVSVARLWWIHHQHGRWSPHVGRIVVARHIGLWPVLLSLRFAVVYELVWLLSTTLVQRTPRMRVLAENARLPRVFDGQVMEWSAAMHLGTSPAKALATAPLPGWWLATMDAICVGWPLVVALVVAIALTTRVGWRRDQLLGAMLVSVFGAALLGLALPCTGPFLVWQDIFPPEGMPLAAARQDARFYHWILDLFPGRGGALVDSGGLWGFPSVPAALVTLAALFTWRMWWPIRVAALAAVPLVGVAMMTAGWHSALSVYAGIALAAAAWWGWGGVMRLTMRRRRALLSD